MQILTKLTHYLEIIITEKGIMAHPDKMKIIRSKITITIVRVVKSFISMCSYYRSFFITAIPIIELKKKFAKFRIWKVRVLLYIFKKASPNTRKPIIFTQILVKNV